MEKDLHKRLEEAAKKSVQHQYNCKGEYPCTKHMYCEMCEGHNTPYDCCECGAGDFKEGFIAGAECGYKEAIAMAKAWLEKNLKVTTIDQQLRLIYNVITEDNKLVLLTDFETEINKLREEKK